MSSFRTRFLVLGVASLALVAGCAPELEAINAPPPTKVAVLDKEAEHIDISKGIALAFECTFQGSPCEDPTAKVEDGAIATVHASYVDELKYAGIEGKAPGTVFVIVGRAEGTTTLTVTSDDGDVEYDVEVVP